MAVSSSQTLKPLKTPESGFYGYVYRFCRRNANNHGDNERFTVHKTSETGPAIILVNGMRHRQDEIELNLAMAKLAMHQVDSTVISINNITNGFFKDLYRSTVLYLGGKSDASRSLCNVLQTKLNQNEPVLIHCHSEGALVVKAALYQLARQNRGAKFRELYPKLKIFSYGGASLFDEKFAPYVKNHISILDPIPLILRPFAIFKYIWAAILLKKRKVEKNPERTVTIGNVQFHPCLSQNPFKEHSFRGSTYTDPFFHELNNSNLKN